MANTTFKGPVRSQNGFQELVDGVWTPVGGGGGGAVTQIITPWPTAGNPVTITIPDPTVTAVTVGQTYEIVIQTTLLTSGENHTLTVTIGAVTGETIFTGSIFNNTDGDPAAPIYIFNQDDFSYTNAAPGSLSAGSGRFVVTYCGLCPFGPGQYHMYTVTGTYVQQNVPG
jgi:hypothetical protein